MIIRIYDSSGKVHCLSNVENGKIEHEEDGCDKLSFLIDTNDPDYILIKEEAKVVYGDNNWLIKKIQDDSVECEIDFDFLKESLLIGHSYKEATLSEVLAGVMPVGWTVTGAELCEATAKQSYEYATPYDVVYDCMSIFDVRFLWKTRTKELEIRIPSQIAPAGKYISDQLNLKSLTFQGSTMDFATRLYCYGKDGTNIMSVNDDKPYIDNNSYSSKVVVAYWSDERYTIPKNLKEAGEKKLAEIAVPVRSYECSVKDLARQSEKYGILSIAMHDKMTLVSSERSLRVVYSVIRYVEYPDSPEDNVVTLSTVPETIQRMTQKSEEKIQQEITKTVEIIKSETSAELAEAINKATQAITGNSGGYVVLFPANNPQEILIMNKPLREEADKIWRWNLNGLGYSKNGYDGPYELAMTMDGEINASMITTGTLQAIEIKACTITGGSLNINDKCKIDSDGHLEAEGATLKGGTVEDIMKADTIPVGKYQIGYNSPTYNLSATEIADAVEPGAIYVPIYTHTEGTETGEVIDCGTPLSRFNGEQSGEKEDILDAGSPADSRTAATIIDALTPEDRTGASATTFVVGKSYRWDGADWSEYGTVLMSESYTSGTDDQLWYCKTDITNEGRFYSSGTLYLWCGNRWNAVADSYAGGRNASEVVSIIGGRITADYIEALSISVNAAQITGMLDAAHINAQDIKVSAANITGTLQASQVDVGGILTSGGAVIGSDIYIAGKTTIDGGKIESNSITADKINATNLSVNAANITGTLSVKDSNGNVLLTAGNNAVYIGGFHVTNTGTNSSIRSDSNMSMTSASNIGVYVGTDGIHVCGKDSSNRYRHTKIDASTGNLYAEDCTISGVVNATSGTFATGCQLGRSLKIAEWNEFYTALCTTGMTFPNSFFDAPSEATAGIMIVSSKDYDNSAISLRSASYSATLNTNRLEFDDRGSYVHNRRFTMSGGNIFCRAGSPEKLVYAIDGYYSPPDITGPSLLQTYCYAGGRGAWKLGLPDNTGLWYYSLCANRSDTNDGGGGELRGTWTGTVSEGSGSDRDIKHDIEDLDEKYTVLFDHLRPVSYKYNDGTSGRKHTGFIAQDVEEAIQTAGLSTQDFAAFYTYQKQVDERECKLTRALRYGEFVALNTREIQKLKARITELENIIKAKG